MSLILSIILIVVALVILAYLIVRHWSQLSVLNVDSIPEVKQNRKKEELLKLRMEKRAHEARNRWYSRMAPAIKELKEVQLAFRKYVGRVERNIIKEEKIKEKQQTTSKKQFEIAKDLQTILQDAAFSFEHGDWLAAEKKYIAAIELDQKNFEAYYGLGQVYLNQKQWVEAEETFKFLNQLYTNDFRVLDKLANLYEERGKIEEAIAYLEQAVVLEDSKSNIFYKIAGLLKTIGQLEPAREAIKQAVELEPQNPKYLDFFLETSIMLGDKKNAEEAFRELRMVNPENQKLVSFRERLNNL